MLAFYSKNPDFGKVGKNDAEDVENPLPSCLDMLLKGNILQKAKRDEMPGLIKTIKADKDVTAVFEDARDDLSFEFRKVAGKGHTGATTKAVGNADGLSMSMDDFYRLMMKGGQQNNIDDLLDED